MAFGQCVVIRSSDIDVTQAKTLLDITSESIRALTPATSRFTNIQQLGRTGRGQQQQQWETAWAGAGAGGGAGAGSGATRYDRSSTNSSSSSSSSQSGGGEGSGWKQWSQQQQQTGGGAAGAAAALSYEQLMGLRVRELKQMLQESGVDSSDCFEKEELARRVVERCRV